MEKFTETIGPHTYGRIVKVPNVLKLVIQYSIKYDTTKPCGDGSDFCDPCTEFPWITTVKIVLE